MWGKFSNKPKWSRTRIIVAPWRNMVQRMLDVIWTPKEWDTLVYSEADGAFVLTLWWGWIYWSEYDSASFTVWSWITDYDVADQQITLFDSVPSAKYIRITTTANIDIKINSTDADATPITTTESPFELAFNWIENIYITTAWSPSDIRIVLVW